MRAVVMVRVRARARAGVAQGSVCGVGGQGS